jgi:dipeptidyl aminopeptidase/acylaminoacyl peptidase
MFKKMVTLVFLALLMFAPNTAQSANVAKQFHTAGSCFHSFPTYDAWIDLMRERNGWLKAWLISWRYDEDRFNDAIASVDCRVGVYRSFDGTSVQAFVVKPKHTQISKPLPMVLYNRGGNQAFGAITLAQLLDFIIPLSKKGYVVAATQYRGGSPRSEGVDEFGGRDVEDVLALGEIVAAMPETNDSQRFMLGISRGAMNTFMALRDAPQDVSERYRAVAVVGGLVDLVEMKKFRPEMERVYRALIPDYASKEAEQLYTRSASLWPEKLPRHVAILQLHGEDDERVSVQSAQTFSKRLDANIESHELKIFAGENHMIRGEREVVVTAIDEWFKQHLNTAQLVSELPFNTKAM